MKSDQKQRVRAQSKVLINAPNGTGLGLGVCVYHGVTLEQRAPIVHFTLFAWLAYCDEFILDSRVQCNHTAYKGIGTLRARTPAGCRWFYEATTRTT